MTPDGKFVIGPSVFEGLLHLGASEPILECSKLDSKNTCYFLNRAAQRAQPRNLFRIDRNSLTTGARTLAAAIRSTIRLGHKWIIERELAGKMGFPIGTMGNPRFLSVGYIANGDLEYLGETAQSVVPNGLTIEDFFKGFNVH